MRKNRSDTNQTIRMSIIALLLLVLTFIPQENLDTAPTVCLHYRFLGFQCPLCGMTRAVHHLMHFDISGALNYNWAVVFLPLYLIADLFSFLLKHSCFRLIRQGIFLTGIGALLVIYFQRLGTWLEWF